MARVVQTVSDTIDPVQIQAAVDQGTEADLRRTMNNDIRAIQAAIQSIKVSTTLDEASKARLTRDFKAQIEQIKNAQGTLAVRVDNRPVVQQVQQAVRVAQAAAPPITLNTRVDNDQVAKVARDFSALGSAAGSALGSVSKLGAGLAGLASGAQGIFAIVTTLEQLAPAAALAAPAILTAVSATAALKLGMVGVGDAVSAAMDPSDPEKFNEALKKLSPNAQAFAKEVRALQPAFKNLQQAVQNKLFEGFGTELKNLSATLLPTVQSKLTDTAGAFNQMGKGLASTAANLSKSGVLGKALDDANSGLLSLSSVPSVILDSLVKVGAAAGPVFARIADSASVGISGLGDKISKSFESGGLQKAIEIAVDQFKLLFDIVKNVATIFSNVTQNAQGFNGVIGILKQVTDALANVTGTEAAQNAFKALFTTVNQLTATALPLIAKLFGILAPVITNLAPGVQSLISALGQGLSPIVEALGPLLTSVAKSVSSVLTALSPLLPVIGELIAQAGTALVPIFDAISLLFVQLSPVITQLATVISTLLKPVLGALPGLLTPFLKILTDLTGTALPIVTQLLEALQPSIQKVGDTFSSLAQALVPVLEKLGELVNKALTALQPLIPPLIDTVTKLANVFADQFASGIENVVIPALQLLVDLLSGDVASAVDHTKTLFLNLVKELVKEFLDLPAQIFLAIGDLSVKLFKAGVDIISGLINGIKSKIGDLVGVLGSITDKLPDWKGPAERDRTILTPAGRSVMDGFMAGISDRIPALAGQLGGITGMVGGTRPGMGAAATGGMAVGGSAASRFASATGALNAGGSSVPNVQVFIGDRELTELVGVQVQTMNARNARTINNGVRR